MSVVGSDLSYDSSPFLSSKYLRLSSMSDTGPHDQHDGSRDTFKGLLQSSHGSTTHNHDPLQSSRDGTSHDLLQSSHDSHDLPFPISHDQAPMKKASEHQVASNSSSNKTRSKTTPPPPSQSKDETFVIKSKPTERPQSPHRETEQLDSRKPSGTRKSNIPLATQSDTRQSHIPRVDPIAQSPSTCMGGGAMAPGSNSSPSQSLEDHSLSSSLHHTPHTHSHTSTTSSSHHPHQTSHHHHECGLNN